MATSAPRGHHATTARKDKKEPYSVGTVTNALRLLEAIGMQGELRIYEAADLLGIARSSAHRLLSTLRNGGFVEQSPDTRAYRIGSRFVAIAIRAYDRMDIRRIAQPHLERLRDEIDETVHLLVLDGDDVRFIAGAECSHMLRVALQIGTALPALDTAGGRAILASRRPSEDIAVDGSTQRPYVTHLRRNNDVVGVGTALGSMINLPPSALATAAPKHRMPPSRIAVIAEHLLLTAQAIEDDVASYRRIA